MAARRLSEVFRRMTKVIAMSKGLVRRGLQMRAADGLPWALTPEEAARELGVTLATVRKFMRVGWLRPLRPETCRIAAHLVRRLKLGRPY